MQRCEFQVVRINIRVSLGSYKLLKFLGKQAAYLHSPRQECQVFLLGKHNFIDPIGLLKTLYVILQLLKIPGVY